MATRHIPVESAIRNLVDKTDLSADQKTRAIVDTVRECNELRIIEELVKLNTYMALITNQNL